MSRYQSAEQRRADMEVAARVLLSAAEAQGMTITSSADVIRVKDTDGTTVLSLYAPAPYGAPRYFVEGMFVPYLHNMVGRRRFATKRSFWRASALKAAMESVQYIRRQNTAETIEAERQRVLRDRHERRSPYAAEVQGCYISGSEVTAFAKAAYLDGFRSGDDGLDNTVRLAVLQDADRLSDSLWYDLLWNSFTPAMVAALDKAV